MIISAKVFARFVKRINAPSKANAKLKALLARVPVWRRHSRDGEK